MRYDAIVIGAGMSGLAAAIRLAQFEKRVVLLERHEVWGGLNSFYTRGGRPFDVGLHALTNFARAGTRGAVLTRLLRALRLRHADLALGEQTSSEICLPGLRLTFTNDFGHFQGEVERAFPTERDGFARLVAAIRAHPLDEEDRPFQSGRARLEEHLRTPELVDALLLPLLFYGGAREEDLDWRELVVLFRSLFLEGLARPAGGIRTLLNLLVKRLKESGAELRLSTGVRSIRVADGAVRGVVLDDGEELESDLVLSSAGRVETRALCGAAPVAPSPSAGESADAGRLSFVESISVLDRRPAELGLASATSFFCGAPPFRYRRPSGLVDVSSGVVSSPDNFAAARPPREGSVRLTVLANHDRWCALAESDYARAKENAADEAIASAARFLPDWRAHTIDRDVFTPRTIRRYTGHAGGAVYGSPEKSWSGRTETEGLVLIGTDQGYLGVIGALVSGVAMANRHGLVGAGIP
jgi:phytoene dehydrogenase-like protein